MSFSLSVSPARANIRFHYLPMFMSPLGNERTPVGLALFVERLKQEIHLHQSVLYPTFRQQLDKCQSDIYWRWIEVRHKKLIAPTRSRKLFIEETSNTFRYDDASDEDSFPFTSLWSVFLPRRQLSLMTAFPKFLDLIATTGIPFESIRAHWLPS